MNKEIKDMRIVVLHRGWIVIGEYEEIGDEVVLTRSFVIRKWGTTKGLGELVSGPTNETVLDKAGTVRAYKLAIVLSIEVDSVAWLRELTSKRLAGV